MKKKICHYKCPACIHTDNCELGSNPKKCHEDI